MPLRFELKDRSDQQLLNGAKELVGHGREATAQLVAHLAEIDERRLFLAEGCSSLFKYCTEVLHLSESAAYHRIDVARLARRFPVILEKLAEGAIHLRALRILGPCLSSENHLALLEAAKHKRKEEVERIAVMMRPRPDVPSVVRKLPEKYEAPKVTTPGMGLFERNSDQPHVETSPGFSETPSMVPLPVTSIPQVVPQRPAVSALSPGRYKIEFTADAETRAALQQLQDLLRHQIPNGDPALIFKKALLLLLEEVSREKFGRTKHPRKRKSVDADLWREEAASGESQVDAVDARQESMASKPPGVDSRESRHIPIAVKRFVWKRDNGRCAFVSRGGRRCTERGRLEFHHVHAYALGGPATIENIALRCRAHNAHESRVIFGGNGLQKRNGKKLTRSGASSGESRQERKHTGP